MVFCWNMMIFCVKGRDFCWKVMKFDLKNRYFKPFFRIKKLDEPGGVSGITERFLCLKMTILW